MKTALTKIARKFLEHFLHIAHAMNHMAMTAGLWDEEDGFFYDVLHFSDGHHPPMKVRSMVGLIPLFAVETLEPDLWKMPDFNRRLEWFIQNKPDLTINVASMPTPRPCERRFLSM